MDLLPNEIIHYMFDYLKHSGYDGVLRSVCSRWYYALPKRKIMVRSLLQFENYQAWLLWAFDNGLKKCLDLYKMSFAVGHDRYDAYVKFLHAQDVPWNYETFHTFIRHSYELTVWAYHHNIPTCDSWNLAVTRGDVRIVQFLHEIGVKIPKDFGVSYIHNASVMAYIQDNLCSGTFLAVRYKHRDHITADMLDLWVERDFDFQVSDLANVAEDMDLLVQVWFAKHGYDDLLPTHSDFKSLSAGKLYGYLAGKYAHRLAQIHDSMHDMPEFGNLMKIIVTYPNYDVYIREFLAYVNGLGDTTTAKTIMSMWQTNRN